MITIRADNDLQISGDGHDFTEVRNRLIADLTWPNPDFAKKERMGKWTGNTPRFLTLVQQLGANKIVVPFGVLKPLYDKLKGQIDFTLEPSKHLSRIERIVSPVPVEDMNLYPYQLKAVTEARSLRNGVIVAPCGSGKTQMGLAICGNLGMRCLWLTHTHELLKQSMDRAKSFLGDKGIGTITEGRVNCGEFITFATVQTMAKLDLAPLREFWDVIIVDECHKAVGTPTRMTMFWKVISALSARYKYGLTATPNRGDGMQKAMFALLGTAVIVSPESVKAMTCPLDVRVVRTYWEPDMTDEMFNPDGTLNYAGFVNTLCRDKERNQLIADLIEDMNGATMVLSERVEHLKTLSEKCSDSKKCAVLSTASKKDREEAMQKIKSGEVEVLFATYQLAKEGLDIPNLRNLVIASPVKDEITVTQSAGRVMRKYPGKDVGTIWDLCDSTRMLESWHRKRMRVYKRLQNEV